MDRLRTRRGDAAATTWIRPEDGSRRRRGRDVTLTWTQVTTHEDNYDIKLEPRDEEAISEIWIGFHSEMHYVSTAA